VVDEITNLAKEDQGVLCAQAVLWACKGSKSQCLLGVQYALAWMGDQLVCEGGELAWCAEPLLALVMVKVTTLAVPLVERVLATSCFLPLSFLHLRTDLCTSGQRSRATSEHSCPSTIRDPGSDDRWPSTNWRRWPSTTWHSAPSTTHYHGIQS